MIREPLRSWLSALGHARDEIRQVCGTFQS
jgi:hypothetical protein